MPGDLGLFSMPDGLDGIAIPVAATRNVQPPPPPAPDDWQLRSQWMDDWSLVNRHMLFEPDSPEQNSGSYCQCCGTQKGRTWTCSNEYCNEYVFPLQLTAHEQIEEEQERASQEAQQTSDATIGIAHGTFATTSGTLTGWVSNQSLANNLQGRVASAWGAAPSLTSRW